MRPWVTVLLLSGCLNSLPTDGDFSTAALACQGVADYGACLAQRQCAASGLMLCGGACVASDEANCGGCGNACPGGTCVAGQCARCSLDLANAAAVPVDGTSALLTCSHLPPGRRVVASMQGRIGAGSVGGNCRSPQANACAHWELVVDTGEQVAIPGNACAATYDAPMPADVTAQHLPVPADGTVRAWVALHEVTISGPTTAPCHGNATVGGIVLAIALEP